MTPRKIRPSLCVVPLLILAGCARAPAPPALPRPVTVAPAPPERVPPPPEVAARPPAPPRPALRLSPTTFEIGPGDPGVQLIVEGEGPNGGRVDRTGEATFEAEPADVLAIEPGGYLRPLKAGEATVRAIVGGDRAAAEIVVGERGERPWDFAEDIVPILTKAGCNTGGCHGKAGGQNGFHLSLFGYDPEGDHRALTREAGGRRVAPMEPDASLVLRKASGQVPHGGGQRLRPKSEEYALLRAWIVARAPLRKGDTHGPSTALRVEPGDVRLEEPGPQQLRVVATYKDGHERDVTRLAVIKPNDETAASVDDAGRARLLRRAEADLIVKYRTDVVATRVATLINPDLDFDFAALPRRNLVDEELFRRLESLKVPPSPPADDAAFLRRVSLDLIGQQPTPEEVRRYLEDTDPEKRLKKVDELLAHRYFAKFWQIKLGDLLGISSARFPGGAGYYQMWLGSRLEENTPWDAMVRELLTARGNPNERGGGPANYGAEGAADPKTQAERTAQRFLGLRLRCAQCHDHPFDVWTQDDYFGLAAIFAKVSLGGSMAGDGMMAMNRPEVTINPEGSVEHLRTHQPATMRLLDGTPVELEDGGDPREALADWMTAPENPYFARAMANWVWAQFFGKGLADPADDLSAANPPVHPELLNALANHFVEHKYDLRDLVRTVATSEAYALSSATVPGNEHDTRLFSHQMPRPLTAHQIADALAQATDVPNRYGQLGARLAIEVNDPATPSTILDTFGRCPRTAGCAPVANPQLSLRQALLVIGGDAIDSKVAHLNGYLTGLLSFDPEPAEIVENLYLRALCRFPTAEEKSFWAAELARAPSRSEAAEDLFWALLNSKEFAFNH